MARGRTSPGPKMPTPVTGGPLLSSREVGEAWQNREAAAEATKEGHKKVADVEEVGKVGGALEEAPSEDDVRGGPVRRAESARLPT